MAEYEEPVVETTKRRKRSLPKTSFKEIYEARYPKGRLLEKPPGQFDYYVLYSGKEDENTSNPYKPWHPKQAKA